MSLWYRMLSHVIKPTIVEYQLALSCQYNHQWQHFVLPPPAKHLFEQVHYLSMLFCAYLVAKLIQVSFDLFSWAIQSATAKISTIISAQSFYSVTTRSPSHSRVSYPELFSEKVSDNLTLISVNKLEDKSFYDSPSRLNFTVLVSFCVLASFLTIIVLNSRWLR